MSSYRTIFNLENLYLEGSPVLLQKGVLFKNTETGQSHIQIKFRNLCDKQITALKVSIVLSNNTIPDCGCIEKQYVDVNATKNKTFGDNIPIFLDNTVASKFFAEIKEVRFIDGETWSPVDESKWQIMPAGKSIGKTFPSEEAVEEFKRTYCKAAIVEPYEYKDVWVCACGNVNKNSETRCLSCGAFHEKMFTIDVDMMHKNGTYRKASELAKVRNSKDIE